MPLMYPPSTEWPPKDTHKIHNQYSEYLAWYSGDADRLASFYGGGMLGKGIPRTYPSQYRGGLVGALSRMWWGRPLTPTQGTTRLHVPAAADVSALSSDLLYSEPLDYELPEGAPESATKRLGRILRRGNFGATLLEAGEMSSAYGGCYLVAFVDTAVSDVPLVVVYGHNIAVPQFRAGRLMSVTFHRRLGEPSERDGSVYRHLELHEVRNGVGVVQHALYLGDSEHLGERVALSSRPETERFELMTDNDGVLPTGIGMLDVAYIPNVKPNRSIDGCQLGRSDYEGVTGAFDALDETWSSWMRDIRLAKSRIVVPATYVQTNGPGSGGYFDAEQEVFTPVNMLGGDENAMQLSQVQFSIRAEEHERSMIAQWRVILRGCGLSSDAFGEDVSGGGGGATAKEISKRGERTEATRSRKILYARPGIEHMVQVLTALDAAHFGGDGMVAGGYEAEVEWPAELPDLESVARTVQLIKAAGATSTKTAVQMIHPRWSDAQVDAEVELIRQEESASAPEPLPALDGLGLNSTSGIENGQGGDDEPADDEPADGEPQ